MSSNRRLKRHIIPSKKFEAEIRQGKKQVGEIYYEFRRRVMVEKPSQVQLREMIDECIARVKATVTNDCVKLAYLRGFSIMLARVGGPVKSADDLYDEAMGEVKGDGPSEESILQAMEMLGMKAPDAEAPGLATETPAGSLAGSTDDSPTPPRFRRSYPPVPPGE